MPRWQAAKTTSELRARVARKLRRRTIPTGVWELAVDGDYVKEAQRGLKKAEDELVEFVRAGIASFRERSLGYVKPGGKRTGYAPDLYDAYTRSRWAASGEERVPADGYLAKEDGRDVVVVWARPWVPPAVVARLYAFLSQSFPGDVHGPQLRSLNLYNFVTARRAEVRETWAATMAAWNKWVEANSDEPGTVYSWVSNFHRDYHRTDRALMDNRVSRKGRQTSP